MVSAEQQSLECNQPLSGGTLIPDLPVKKCLKLLIDIEWLDIEIRILILHEKF